MEKKFIFISKVDIQHFALQDSISIITIIITHHPGYHATYASDASMPSTQTHHLLYPRYTRQQVTDVTHTTHANTFPAQARYPTIHASAIAGQFSKVSSKQLLFSGFSTPEAKLKMLIRNARIKSVNFLCRWLCLISISSEKFEFCEYKMCKLWLLSCSYITPNSIIFRNIMQGMIS